MHFWIMMHNIGTKLRGNICEKGNSYTIKTIGHTVNETFFVPWLNTLLASSYEEKEKKNIVTTHLFSDVNACHMLDVIPNWIYVLDIKLKYHTVSKSKITIVESDTIVNPNIQIHDFSLSC